jgi:3-oxoacyl-[acyl-carrier protein] reductase
MWPPFHWAGFGQPDDIADIAVFLASDQAGWLTGELITAGGGLH